MSRLSFDIRVAEPCTQMWAEMTGSNSRRYCTACKRSVHNLESLTARQIETLLVESNGSLCGRVRTLADHSIAHRAATPTRSSIAFLALSALGGLTKTASAQAPALPHGQSPLEAIVAGSVTDQTGALVVGARIFAAVGSTQVASTLTDGQGDYRLALPIGSYVLTVAAEGFHATVVPVQVESNPVSQDVAMRPTATDSITVTADTIDIASATVGAVVSTIFYGRWYKRVGYRLRHPVAYTRYLLRPR